MSKPPSIPEDRDSAPNLTPPRAVRIPAGCLAVMMLGAGLLSLIGALTSLSRGEASAAASLGLGSLLGVAAAAGIWFGAAHTYRKLAREFHEAGANWQDQSNSIFEVQRHPSEPRARELAAWAAQSNMTYYSVRRLPVLRRVFYMMHFGKMHNRIMEQYQQAIPDADPNKFRYWQNVTPQRQRHWERYLSAHPEFRAFAGGRLYAPWAGLVWGGAMFGSVKRLILGEAGGFELLVYDEHVPAGDDSKKWIDRTRVLMSSPYTLKVLTIAPEIRDSRTDVDFESIEFNSAFRVDADDKRWAFSVITPRMMEHLLASPRFCIEFDSNYIAAHDGDRLLSAEEIGHAAAILEDLVELLPEYLGNGDGGG